MLLDDGRHFHVEKTHSLTDGIGFGGSGSIVQTRGEDREGFSEHRGGVADHVLDGPIGPLDQTSELAAVGNLPEIVAELIEDFERTADGESSVSREQKREPFVLTQNFVDDGDREERREMLIVGAKDGHQELHRGLESTARSEDIGVEVDVLGGNGAHAVAVLRCFEDDPWW